MKLNYRNTLTVLASCFLFVGCPDGAAEDAGEEIDEGIEDLRDGVEDVIDETGDQLEEAAEELEEAAEGGGAPQ